MCVGADYSSAAPASDLARAGLALGLASGLALGLTTLACFGKVFLLVELASSRAGTAGRFGQLRQLAHQLFDLIPLAFGQLDEFDSCPSPLVYVPNDPRHAEIDSPDLEVHFNAGALAAAKRLIGPEAATALAQVHQRSSLA